MYVGHTHSTRRQMYIVCVCVSSTLRVPFRYPSGSLLRSKLDPLASMGWLWVAWALLAVAPAPLEPEARNYTYMDTSCRCNKCIFRGCYTVTAAAVTLTALPALSHSLTLTS